MPLLRALHHSAAFSRRVRVLSAELARDLPPDAVVLDVGAGDGSIAAAVMTLRPDVQVTGLDVLVRPDTRVPVIAYDGRTIPFRDRSHDIVMLVDVLHHSEDPVALLAEAARVASVAVLVKDHRVKGFLATPTLRFMDWFGNSSYGVDLPYNYLTESEWDVAFDRAGLVAERERLHLALYPRPASWVFDRDLHAIWWLTPVPPAGSEGSVQEPRAGFVTDPHG